MRQAGKVEYIKLIKITEKQQIDMKVPQFSATAFLGGLFITIIYIWHCRKSSVADIIDFVGKCVKNEKHNKLGRCRLVAIAKFNLIRKDNQLAHNV